MTTQRYIYEFDDFRIDSGQFLLTRGGRSEPMTPTVFRILLTLLERAGELVSKNELMRQVWPDSYVEEGNLNRNVSTLRRALGESPRDHRYIETLPKMGYRFSAPVKRIEYQPPTGPRKAQAETGQRIVGRDEERSELRRAYERAQAGHGSLVCISGDVGLGKTALLDSFLDDLVQAGYAFNLARARSSEALTETEPFMPWIEALGALAREAAAAETMQKAAPTWHREISHTGNGDPRSMKRELLDFFREVSPVHPLIVMLDDFHWSDVDSVDLLSYLSTRLESTRVLIVVSYRLGEMRVNRHPFVAVRSELLTRHACKEIHLDCLKREDVQTHLSSAYSDYNFPEDYAGFLHAKTEGNPLFIRELARKPGELTESIRNVILRKLDRVSHVDRELLLTASVQGREFDSAVLARSLGMKPEDVEERLKCLDEIHGFIQRIREEELPDGKFSVRYRFVYALYQEVCYASLAPSRKASMNASLAEAFLTHYGT